MKNTKNRVVAATAMLGSAIAWLLLAGIACDQRGTVAVSEPADQPLVIVGVDGLEWRVMLEMLGEGRLPVMARLMREGSFGYLSTLEPTRSPVIWTSIATGKGPEKHGILGFTNTGNPNRSLYTSEDRKTKALWNIFSDYDRRVGSIGWWMTFPAEEISGAMIAQTNTSTQIRRRGRRMVKGRLVPGLDGQVTPVALQERVLEIAREVDETLPARAGEVFGEFRAPLSPAGEGHWNMSQWSFRADATYLSVTLELLGSPTMAPFDLLMIYFGAPDVAGHHFWRYAYPEEFADAPPSEDVANFSQTIRQTYSWVDRSIGEILGSVGREATVLVVSDHGMHATQHERDFSPDKPVVSGHHQNGPAGVLIAAGPSIRRALHSDVLPVDTSELTELGSVLDLAPTLLALAGLPIGRDMDGTVIEALFEDGFLERHPSSFIDTHDTAEWLAERSGRRLSPEAEQERLEQLRSLGYID